MARAPGLRLSLDALQTEILAVVIKRAVFRIDPLDDRDPFGGIVVALIVLAQRDAEHRELLDVPARHDVEPEPALPDMVRGGDRFRREHRMHQWHMDGG